MSKRELLASAAQVESALKAAKLKRKNEEESKRKAAAREQHSPRADNAPRHEPGDHHHRHGDRGDSDEGDGSAPDVLVPDPAFCKEFSITSMTLWRWDRDPRMVELGLPPPVKIRERNFRFRRQIERFKQNLIHRAIQARGDAA
jgi:hypothetical protein